MKILEVSHRILRSVLFVGVLTFQVSILGECAGDYSCRAGFVDIVRRTFEGVKSERMSICSHLTEKSVDFVETDGTRVGLMLFWSLRRPKYRDCYRQLGAKATAWRRKFL